MTLLVPGLLKQGFPSEAAILTAAALPIISIPGRLLFGWWGDYLDKRKLLAACFTLQAIGLIILANATTNPLLVVFVLVYGSASGGSGPLTTALQVEHFGTKAMGTVQGLLQGSAFIDTLLAPVFVGIIADSFGSYRPAWLILGIGVAAAGPMLLSMPKLRPVRDQPPTPSA